MAASLVLGLVNIGVVPVASEAIIEPAHIGIALHQGDDTPALADMLARADSALYRAKAEGRNRCLVAD